jgi:lipopolysaccharide transport system ATP-binding protein
MFNDIVIKVENLAKVYKLYDSPQDRLKESLHPLRKKYHKDFYALSGVSFEIKKGETVGIIGRNGSGKSTLLKTITGVLTPTSGSVMVNGKVSALLELGAGFNPQLTGLENVYFNGMIQGFTREEMDAKLDTILSFADIGDFVHQPVKTYSSGMFVRLAFAVAINVEPDLLIVDEALSVGDEAFQRKCFSRILDFKKNGKTILFVSHSAATIVELCDRAILFDHGELILEATPKPVVSRYQKLIYAPADKLNALKDEYKAYNQSLKNQSALVESNTANDGCDENDLAEELNEATPIAQYDPHLLSQSVVSYESHGVTISEPMITTLSGEKVNILVRGGQYVYSYLISFKEDAYNVRFGMLIKTVSGLELGGMISHPKTDTIPFIPHGTVKKQSFMFRASLIPGAYFMNAGVQGAIDGSEKYLHRITDAMMFKVQPEAKLCATGMVDFTVGTL